MLDLQVVKGIDAGGADLLRAVGVEGVPTLSMCDPADLLDEMGLANRHLELVEALPSVDDLTGWIEEAKEIDRQEREQGGPRLEVVESSPVEIPVAVAVSKEYIIEHQISVSDVPVMEEFVTVGEVPRPTAEPRRKENRDRVKIREVGLKAFPEGVGGQDGSPAPRRKDIAPLKRTPGLDLRKTASPELNVGKRLHSRSYIRGVLHPQPWRVKIGGIITLLTLLMMPMTFVSGLLILTVFQQQVLENPWLLAFPAAFFLFGLFYLFQARSVKCRVCGQPIFSPKACRRNPKAHRFLFLGYIFPTCIHMLIFHWFRCMYCGTSVRLKE